MKYLVILVFIVGGAFIQASAQNTNNIWYFGDGNFIDFNAAPSIAANGVEVATATSTYCLEGSSTMCDANGQLLFYSDGRNVWDRNYNLTPGGTGLDGHLSTAQCLIIPQPGSNSIYYIFHADYAGNAGGLKYTEVDMSLNGGLGDVTLNKNIPLHSPASEQMKAVTHCNGTDIWVISHSATGNVFYAYLVSSTGVNTTAVTTSIGTGLGSIFDGMSYLTCTADGSRLALANGTSFELFDFDNQNGKLCNVVTVPTGGFAGIYGIEFSPDASKIYTSDFGLTQFDITSNNANTVSASAVDLGVNEPAAIMRAPDNKLYIASGCDWYDAGAGVMYTVRLVHSIDNPNVLGLGCNVQQGYFQTPRECGLGLPTNYYPTQTTSTCGPVLTADFSVINTSICENDCIGFTNLSEGPIVSYNWSFPGGTPSTFTGATPPNICFVVAGTYNVTLDVEDCSGNLETQQLTITVDPCNTSTPDFTTVNTTICANDCVNFQDLSVGSNISSWQWTFSGGTPSSSSDQHPTGICYNTPGTYDVSLTITDDNGTHDIALTAYMLVEDCSNPPVDPPSPDPDKLHPIIYVPNAFTPDGDGLNDEFFPVISTPTNNYRFSVYNRWGQLVFESYQQGEGWKPSDFKQDIYAWKLELSFPSEFAIRSYSKIGHVTLLK
jgi:gliding motility-associated-like protein